MPLTTAQLCSREPSGVLVGWGWLGWDLGRAQSTPTSANARTFVIWAKWAQVDGNCRLYCCRLACGDSYNWYPHRHVLFCGLRYWGTFRGDLGSGVSIPFLWSVHSPSKTRTSQLTPGLTESGYSMNELRPTTEAGANDSFRLETKLLVKPSYELLITDTLNTCKQKDLKPLVVRQSALTDKPECAASEQPSCATVTVTVPRAQTLLSTRMVTLCFKLTASRCH